MTEYFIRLSDSDYDNIELDSSQVDLLNYDNNKGYDVYCLALYDSNGNIIEKWHFNNRDDMYNFASDNEFTIIDNEWIYNSDEFSITCVDGSRWYTIPCLCDVLIYYCVEQ